METNLKDNTSVEYLFSTFDPLEKCHSGFSQFKRQHLFSCLSEETQLKFSQDAQSFLTDGFKSSISESFMSFLQKKGIHTVPGRVVKSENPDAGLGVVVEVPQAIQPDGIYVLGEYTGENYVEPNLSFSPYDKNRLWEKEIIFRDDHIVAGYQGYDIGGMFNHAVVANAWVCSFQDDEQVYGARLLFCTFGWVLQSGREIKISYNYPRYDKCIHLDQYVDFCREDEAVLQENLQVLQKIFNDSEASLRTLLHNSLQNACKSQPIDVPVTCDNFQKALSETMLLRLGANMALIMMNPWMAYYLKESPQYAQYKPIIDMICQISDNYSMIHVSNNDAKVSRYLMGLPNMQELLLARKAHDIIKHPLLIACIKAPESFLYHRDTDRYILRDMDNICEFFPPLLPTYPQANLLRQILFNKTLDDLLRDLPKIFSGRDNQEVYTNGFTEVLFFIAEKYSSCATSHPDIMIQIQGKITQLREFISSQQSGKSLHPGVGAFYTKYLDAIRDYIPYSTEDLYSGSSDTTGSRESVLSTSWQKLYRIRWNVKAINKYCQPGACDKVHQGFLEKLSISSEFNLGEASLFNLNNTACQNEKISPMP